MSSLNVSTSLLVAMLKAYMHCSAIIVYCIQCSPKTAISYEDSSSLSVKLVLLRVTKCLVIVFRNFMVIVTRKCIFYIYNLYHTITMAKQQVKCTTVHSQDLILLHVTSKVKCFTTINEY